MPNIRIEMSHSDVHLFVRAIALAQTKGLKPADLRHVDARWMFISKDLIAAGFILRTRRGKRVYMEYSRDEASEGLSELILLERLRAGERNPSLGAHLRPVKWSSDVDHLNGLLPSRSRRRRTSRKQAVNV
jgi:hypothetical protein